MHTRIVYCSFDRFPSPKGAATHIEAFVSALGEELGPVDLVTLPHGFSEAEDDSLNSQPKWKAAGVTHYQLESNGADLFDRASRFRRNLDRWWASRFAGHRPDVVHFRSIFEGYPIAVNKSDCCRKIVFEVNGLPSIELKYHYPKVADDNELLRKIRHQEDVCIQEADQLLTVSEVNKRHLISRGAEPDKIEVIRNGVDLETFPFRHRNDQELESMKDSIDAIYSGTMSSWQGVLHAIESIGLYRRDAKASLVLVGPYRKKESDAISRKIDSWELDSCIELMDAVSKPSLCDLYHRKNVMLAPLTRCDRNSVQGCCPLKIIEAMAAGIPVIASRLPAVEELVTHDTDGLLVRPNSAKSIKDAMFRLRDEPGLAIRLASNARKKVEDALSWQHAKRKLVEVYRRLL